MSDGKPSAKWEAKQRAAQEAEAKFAANQARAAGRKRDRRAERRTPDTPARPARRGVLAWLAAHKLIAGCLGALLAGGVIFATCAIVRHQLRNAPGTPAGELMVGETLILLDHVAVGGTDSKGRAQQETASGQRLTSIDTATGAQLAVEVGDYQRCFPAGSRLACLDIYDRLDLLDARTLAVTHRAADLIATAKLAKPTRQIRRDGDAFVVVLEDGRGARIDPSPATPIVTALDSVPSSFEPPPRSGCEVSFRRKVGQATLTFDTGSTRARLTSDPPPPAESATPSGPALTYLEGRFLVAPEPLVLHRASLAGPEHLLSRIDGVSKERWQVPLEGECRRTYVVGATLVVTTGNPRRRALGIDLASGRVAWTFDR